MRACSRPKMAVALATDTCCETMIAARPAKPGSRRRSGGGPPIAIRRSTSSGSLARRRSAASRKARLVGDRRAGMIDPLGRRDALGAPGCAAPPAYACALLAMADEHPRDRARPALRAVAERRAPSRPRLFGAHATSASPPRPTDACCCALKTWTARAASRNSRPRSSTTSPGSAFAFAAPPRRQSEHGDDYAAALARLEERGPRLPLLLQPRRGRARFGGRAIPDGAPLYPGTCRALSPAEARDAPRARRQGRVPARHARARSTPRRRVSVWSEYRRGRRSRRSVRRSRRLGATSSSAGAIWRRATIWRWSSTTRCRASPTSCAGATCLPRPRSTGCCRSCSACPRRAIATIGSFSTRPERNCRRAVNRRRSPNCAQAGLTPARSSRRAGVRRRRRRRTRGRAQLSFAVAATGADAGFSAAIAAAEGACAISWSMRSRSRLNAASILPSNSRVRGELDRHRVDEVAVDDHLVMQVRAGRQSRIAEIADGLALDDVGALDDAAAKAGHVVVGGHVAVGVLDLDPPPVADVPLRLDDDAVAGGDRSACRSAPPNRRRCACARNAGSDDSACRTARSFRRRRSACAPGICGSSGRSRRR